MFLGWGGGLKETSKGRFSGKNRFVSLPSRAAFRARVVFIQWIVWIDGSVVGAKRKIRTKTQGVTVKTGKMSMQNGLLT